MVEAGRNAAVEVRHAKGLELGLEDGALVALELVVLDRRTPENVVNLDNLQKSSKKVIGLSKDFSQSRRKYTVKHSCAKRQA